MTSKTTSAISIFLPNDREVFERDDDMPIQVRLDKGAAPGKEVRLSLCWRVRGTGVATGPAYDFDLTLPPIAPRIATPSPCLHHR